MKDLRTLTLRNGTVLHLVPVNADAIFSLYNKMGLYDALDKITDFDGPPEEWTKRWEANLSLEEKVQGAQLTQQLFNYCAGWGVTNDVPPEAMKELDTIGCDTSTERAARVSWLRFVLLDEGESAELIGRVMALTQIRGAGLEQSMREKEEQIKKLEEQVAVLKEQME